MIEIGLFTTIIGGMSAAILGLAGFIAYLIKGVLADVKADAKFWRDRDAARDGDVRKLSESLDKVLDYMSAQSGTPPHARR